MRNIWLVAQHEFLKNIRKRSFLFAVFGIPLMMVAIFAVVFFVSEQAEVSGTALGAIGVVDEASVLVEEVALPEDYTLMTADEAREALEAEEISAYFLLPENYLSRGTVELYAYGSVGIEAQNTFEDFLLENLTARVEIDAPAERVEDPADMVIYLENNQRELTENAFIGLFLVPMIFAVILMVALQLSGTSLMSGIVEEKSNHIMEILITSIRPMELLTGKLIGLGVLGLVQLGVWVVIGRIVLLFGADIEFLSAVTLPLDLVVLALVYFLLTYFLMAGVLAGIGAVAGSEQESRQIAGVLWLLIVIPFFFFAQLLSDPDAPLLVGLTLFPFTAGMTYLLRTPFTTLPFTEVALSLGILLLTTVFVAWASAKVFRWALLLYGQKPNLRTLWRVLRGNPDIGIVPVTDSQKGKSA
jgi:ABC-2 type transport system permease protein